MVTDLVEQHRAELEELCRMHRVKTLEVFGSAVDGRFDPTQSDLDFLVAFLPLRPTEHADAYFGLLHGMEDLFHRKIDLVETSGIRNPYFLKSVNLSRKVLYAGGCWNDSSTRISRSNSLHHSAMRVRASGDIIEGR